MSGLAVLTLDPDGDGEVLLVVTGNAGEKAYRAVMTAPRAIGFPAEVSAALGKDLERDLRDQAEEELAVAGWVRDEAWEATVVDGVRVLTVAVITSPRMPISPHDQRALDALHQLTTMARGPVTSAALVPQIAPRWQVAAAVMRRLVVAGQVRAVGRTREGRMTRMLYAPVGTKWAPEVTALP